MFETLTRRRGEELNGMPDGLLALKYLSWLLTVGIPFVGTWFFDFTSTNKDTGRKVLTTVGTKAIYLSALSLACALTVSIWTDYRSVESERRSQEARAKAEARAEEERARATEFQAKSLKAQDDTYRLVELIGRNFSQLPASVQTVVRDTVGRLSSTDDMRREYPELFAKLESAKTFDDAMGVLTEAHYRKVSERVRTSAAGCSSIRIERLEPGLPHGYPGATFKTTPTRSGSGEVLFVSYMVDPSGIRLTMTWISPDPKLMISHPFENGYNYEFADGTTSPVVRCNDHKVRGVCEIHTESGGQASDLYRLLQSKRASRVFFGDRSFAFVTAEGESLRNTLACIAP